jgi:hypothetical protein
MAGSWIVDGWITVAKVAAELLEEQDGNRCGFQYYVAMNVA